MQKETGRVFLWGSVISTTLTIIVCILLFVQSLVPRTAFAASAGALLLAAGLVIAVAFFLGQPVHAARMLAGVVQVSLGLWALITCKSFSRSVFALGTGIFLLLAAASEVFAALAHRRNVPLTVLRFVLAAGDVVTGALLIANNFTDVFPTVNAALITAGAFMLAFCAAEGFVLLREGLFSEETLTFRPEGRGENGQQKK